MDDTSVIRMVGMCCQVYDLVFRIRTSGWTAGDFVRLYEAFSKLTDLRVGDFYCWEWDTRQDARTSAYAAMASAPMRVLAQVDGQMDRLDLKHLGVEDRFVVLKASNFAFMIANHRLYPSRPMPDGYNSYKQEKLS